MNCIKNLEEFNEYCVFCHSFNKHCSGKCRITRLENKLGVEETFSLKASMDSHFEMSKGHQSFNKP